MAGKLVSYAHIEPEKPEWLWEPFLPEGEPVVIVGKRGIGKGMLGSRITSIITNGDPWPGQEEPRDPANVVLATSEDDPRRAMAWRLRAAGADVSRVFNATEGTSLPSGIERLGNEIADIGNVALVWLDPFTSFTEVPLGASNDRVRNELMTPLREQLATPLGITLACVVHVTKAGKTVGSGAIEDVPRMVLKVERLRANPSVRRLYVEKSNIGPDDGETFYCLAGDGLDTHAVFIDETDASAVMADASAPVRILMELRKATEPQSARAIAQLTGIPYGTVRTALTRLGQAEGTGVFSPKHGVWWSHEALEDAARKEGPTALPLAIARARNAVTRNNGTTGGS